MHVCREIIALLPEANPVDMAADVSSSFTFICIPLFRQVLLNLQLQAALFNFTHSEEDSS